MTTTTPSPDQVIRALVRAAGRGLDHGVISVGAGWVLTDTAYSQIDGELTLTAEAFDGTTATVVLSAVAITQPVLA